MDNLAILLPIIISALALGISFLNYRTNRKNVISGVISTDRIKWISDVRELMSQFLELYIEEGKRKELRIVKAKIDLYIIYEKDVYKGFEEKLNHCIEHSYTKEDYRELMEETQKMLNGVWLRIKDEAGITKREESKINRLVHRRRNSNP